MGWFLWGIVFGWAACAIYHCSQEHKEQAGIGAIIVFLALAIIALIVSVNLGIVSGELPSAPTATPLLGR
jgi:cell division protein FtsW (lipid II flippase)